MTPSERLSLAIHMESAAIAPQTSELIEAAKEVLRENDALWQRYVDANEALIEAVDAYEEQCSSHDEWCGSESCSKCGGDAKLIAGWRRVIHQQTITLSEPTPEQEAYLRRIEEASKYDPKSQTRIKVTVRDKGRGAMDTSD